MKTEERQDIDDYFGSGEMIPILLSHSLPSGWKYLLWFGSNIAYDEDYV
jgi:hypothetical protein